MIEKEDCRGTEFDSYLSRVLYEASLESDVLFGSEKLDLLLEVVCMHPSTDTITAVAKLIQKVLRIGG